MAGRTSLRSEPLGGKTDEAVEGRATEESFGERGEVALFLMDVRHTREDAVDMTTPSASRSRKSPK